MKNHVASCHGPMTSVRSDQPKTEVAFTRKGEPNPKSELKERRAVLLYCKEPSVSFTIAGSPWMIQGYGQPVSAKKLPEVVLSLARELWEDIQLLPEVPMSVLPLMAGLTRHAKMINFIVIWQGKVKFWCTLPSVFRKQDQCFRRSPIKSLQELSKIGRCFSGGRQREEQPMTI